MGVEAGDGEARALRCRTGAAARGSRRGPWRRSRSTLSSSGTSRSGIWVVTGITCSVGPASIIATSSLDDAAALGDELGLAGMDEADRVELRLGDRPGDQRPRRRPSGSGRPRIRARRASCARLPGRAARARRSVSVLTRRIGSARSNAADRRRRDRRSTATGPSQTARTAETLPTAKKGGSASSRRRSQLLAMTSAPMPAGSPSETASGMSAGSAIIDHRVAPQVAQVALRPAVRPAARSSCVVDLVRRSAPVAAAGSSRPHRTRTLTRSVEPNGGVAWPTLRLSSICCSIGGSSRTRTWSLETSSAPSAVAASPRAAAAAHRLGRRGRAAAPRGLRLRLGGARRAARATSASG